MIFDDIFKEIGDFGRGQKIQYFLLCWPFLMAGFLSVDVVFLMAVPEFVCRPDNEIIEQIKLSINTSSIDKVTKYLIELHKINGNYKNLRCSALTNTSMFSNFTFNKTNASSFGKCTNGFLYSKKQYGTTIPQEFDLVCDYDYVRQNLKTIFFVGRIFGAIIFGQLSDLIGRLLTFLIVVVVNIVTGIGLYFSVSPIMAGLFLLFQGFAQVGYTLTTFVLGTEMVGTSKRKWTGIIIQLFYTVAFMLIPVSYYFMQNWRYLALLSGLPSLIFLTYYFYAYESPRWLLSQGRTKEVLAIAEKLAKTNNVILSEKMKSNILSHNDSQEHKKETQKNYSILDLIKTKPMALLSLNVWFNWVVNALVYYGIIYNVENLSGSLYLNFMWLGLMEIPAAFVCILFLDRLGRKRLLVISLWATGLACLVSGCIPKEHSTIISIVAMTGKLFVSISYGVIYFFTAELFPTVVRNAAMGMSSTFGRIGGTVAIPILGLQSFFLPLPMIIFAVLAATAGGLTFVIPETKGKPMDRQFYQNKSQNNEDENHILTEEKL